MAVSKIEYQWSLKDQRYEFIWWYDLNGKPKYSGVFFKDLELKEALPKLVNWLNKCLEQIEEQKKVPKRKQRKL